ncbi:MAG: hypothetical protein EPO26_01170 [Chloroflexota bacterium]|nr:MAG: hypothetical protein EPO26_01170 [Chloroflexota bacterium]
MTATDRDFARLVAAGRDLLDVSPIVSLQHWAAAAELTVDAIKTTYLADTERRAALEVAIGARCVNAEGGCFLIASR